MNLERLHNSSKRIPSLELNVHYSIELEVLEALKDLDFTVVHPGTYYDFYSYVNNYNNHFYLKINR